MPPKPIEPAPHAPHLALAHQLADVARTKTLRHFRTPVRVENKAVDGFDPVTVADVAAEKAMRQLLKRLAPDHGVSGEELADTVGAGRYTWVLDPIDGTRAYMAGLPLWGTLIGLVEDGKPIVGLMDQPFTGERFFGSPAGAFLTHGGQTLRLKTRGTTRLTEATLMATTPDMFKGRGERAAFGRLEATVRLRRFGGDCYAYAMLAAGHIDLVVEASLKAVDIVPLIPIIEAAGGVVSTWDGGDPLHGGRILAAANGDLHRDAQAVLLNAALS
jgi:histidinol phosphatase-like enzyme (inositol monophosphatase family)